MGFITLALDTSPNATAYDEDYPTRSTELLNHQLHKMIEDMEGATGYWYLTDGAPTTQTVLNGITDQIYDDIEDVFDYADTAITNYRSSGSPSISKPTATTQWRTFNTWAYTEYANQQLRVKIECMKMKFKIYYMWMTEEDPLLLKEKLQELLVAWPLMDTTIDLQTESGQTIRMYPSWKNVDLDL